MSLDWDDIVTAARRKALPARRHAGDNQHHLVMRERERVGGEASLSGAVIDSQSVKKTESDGVRGYDAGKKVTGRKRDAIVDTDGRALKL